MGIWRSAPQGHNARTVSEYLHQSARRIVWRGGRSDTVSADSGKGRICLVFGLIRCSLERGFRQEVFAVNTLATIIPENIVILPESASRPSTFPSVEAALRASMQALDDWLVTYASDMCDHDAVTAAYDRISVLGTIGYIASVQEQCRAALEAIRKGEA